MIHENSAGCGETKGITVLFKTRAACTQEKSHGGTYDEIRCGSECKPSEHKPFAILHKDFGSDNLIPNDDVRTERHVCELSIIVNE